MDPPVDLLAPGFIADPVPILAGLQRAAPVAPVVQGGVLLTRHADVLAALSDPRLGNAPSRFSTLAPRNAAKYPAAALVAHLPPFLDMPEHRLPRQALSRAFHRSFAAFGPRLDQLALTAAACPEVLRFRADIAAPFARRAMAEFCGIDPDPDLARLSTAFFRLFAPIADPEVFAAVNADLARYRDLTLAATHRRRAAPGDDLISGLLALRPDLPELSDRMIADLAILVHADGIENVEAACLSVWTRLCDCAAAPTGPAVDEALRLDPPAQILPRVLRADADLQGIALRAGTPVWLALGAANRDPQVFAEADAFRPDRADAASALTFGRGRHGCIGAPLARAMIGALMRALAATGRQVDRPSRWEARFGHRWPGDVAVGPAAGQAAGPGVSAGQGAGGGAATARPGAPPD